MRFTVRGPAGAEVSPCCHRPSGGDVACGVDVGVARARIAGDALEDRLALAVFRRGMPAVGASLRRIRCRNEFDPPAGLVLQPGDKQSPPLAADLTVKAPFVCDVGARTVTSSARRASHGTQVQVLDADRVEAAGQIGCGLFHPITTAIGIASPQASNRQLRSCSPVRSALSPGQTPLQAPQPLGFTGTKARNVQQRPRRQRSRHCHAAVNTNGTAVARSRDRFRDDSKSDVPSPRPIRAYSIRLHGAGDGAGPPEPHPTDLRYPDLAVAATQPFDVARFEPDLPESFIFAGLSPRWTPVGPLEKVAHCLGEVPQCLLLYGLRPGGQPIVFGAGSRQLGALLVIARRLAARLPVPLLLYGQIPDKPGMATVFGQRSRLAIGWKQAEPGHSSNVTVATDNLPKGGKRRFLPC